MSLTHVFRGFKAYSLKNVAFVSKATYRVGHHITVYTVCTVLLYVGYSKAQ